MTINKEHSEQPVACLVETEQGVMVWPIEDINEAGTYCEENEFPVLLYTFPPAQQEPVAWLTETGSVWKSWAKDTDTPLYTFPPQRTWVGLTDKEIIDLIHSLVMANMPDEATDYEIARVIEAKLKELNI